jgi:hypothetical protein
MTYKRAYHVLMGLHLHKSRYRWFRGHYKGITAFRRLYDAGGGKGKYDGFRSFRNFDKPFRYRVAYHPYWTDYFEE